MEAIETEFIPVLIYNNREGKDAELLARYDEPAWNFQVIRFFDSLGHDIIPRKDRVWKIGEVARRMCEALKTANKRVPLYLTGLALEQNNQNIHEAAFAVSCSWNGETHLGAMQGVVGTEAGFVDGREAIRVWYDETVISLSTLARKASQVRCASKVYVETEEQIRDLEALQDLNLPATQINDQEYEKAKPSEQKRQIQNSLFMELGLTEFQRTKVNAFIQTDSNKALEYLSPRQMAVLQEIPKD